MIYRQYLKKGDVFVHADLDGAIPVIIKNKIGAPDSPIPPGTLSQAGTLSVATSIAWDSKAVIAAWWAKAEQVSKTAPTGDYLSPGNFFVRGDKKFLPPAQLVLGFAVLFHISEDSLVNHTKHRMQEGEGVGERIVNQVEEAGVSSPPMEESNENEQKDFTDDEMESDNGSEDETVKPEEPRNSLQPSDAVQEKRDMDETSSKVNENNEEDEEVESEEDEHNEELDDNVSVQTANEQEQPDKKQDKEESIASNPRSSTPSQTKKSHVPQTRGKKGKKKKLKEKYAHQDEEERELALRLLGSGTKPDKAVEAEKAKAAREAEAEAQKERRRAQHNRAAEAERQRELSFAKQEGQEGPNSRAQDLTEAEIADLECIPCFVGTPVPGDEILAAVPICAPWAALAQCKFRTKLQPGSTKKGKAVKDMLGRWISDATVATSRSRKGRKSVSTAEDVGMEVAGEENDRQGDKGQDIEARELELIKGWRDVEVINTVPVGKVRVVTSAGGGGDKGKGNAKGKGNSKKGGGKGGRGSKKQK